MFNALVFYLITDKEKKVFFIKFFLFNITLLTKNNFDYQYYNRSQ